jgi:tRNA(Ile)-lysidine synthase
VELFFLRVLRGAGGEGLAGMKWRSPSPVNLKVRLVRPLLGCSKTEILAYARGNKISFREDATNVSNDYLRNRIRNELLPLLRGHYLRGLARSVLRLMEIVGAEAEAVGQLTENWSKLRRPVFGKLPVAIQRRVLQAQLTRLAVSPDFELVESLRQAPGVAVSTGPNLSVARDAAGGIVIKKSLPAAGFNAKQLALNLTGRAGDAEFDGVVLSWRLGANRQKVQLKSGREFFDADAIGGRFTLRHWRPGDRFQPIGLPAAVKLQDLFTNAKIPRDRRRDLIVAAAADGEIFWVEGLRISENFKLTAETRCRLVWCWRRQKP